MLLLADQLHFSSEISKAILYVVSRFTEALQLLFIAVLLFPPGLERANGASSPS